MSEILPSPGVPEGKRLPSLPSLFRREPAGSQSSGRAVELSRCPLAVGSDAGRRPELGAPSCSALAVARATHNVNVSESDRFPELVPSPSFLTVVRCEVGRRAAIGAERLSASSSLAEPVPFVPVSPIVSAPSPCFPFGSVRLGTLLTLRAVTHPDVCGSTLCTHGG